LWKLALFKRNPLLCKGEIKKKTKKKADAIYLTNKNFLTNMEDISPDLETYLVAIAPSPFNKPGHFFLQNLIY